MGEIYLRQEDSDLLKCMIYQTSNGDKLWKKTIYRFGEGVIGKKRLKIHSPVSLIRVAM